MDVVRARGGGTNLCFFLKQPSSQVPAGPGCLPRCGCTGVPKAPCPSSALCCFPFRKGKEEHLAPRTETRELWGPVPAGPRDPPGLRGET